MNPRIAKRRRHGQADRSRAVRTTTQPISIGAGDETSASTGENSDSLLFICQKDTITSGGVLCTPERSGHVQPDLLCISFPKSRREKIELAYMPQNKTLSEAEHAYWIA